MGTVKILTAPIWFPFWLIWTVLAFIGRTFWFFFTLMFKILILALAIFGLIVLLWR
jgi:hypothetical protein